MSNGVIVLGGHVQGLGILRILGRDNIPGIVIDNTGKNLAKHSKYCQKYYIIQDTLLLTFLLGLEREGLYHRWIVFPTNDFHVKLLSQNKQQLEPYFIIGADRWEKVLVFYNKINTYRLAKELNIPIANTFFPGKVEDLELLEIAYPCIIKPAVMYDFYTKIKQKVLVCKDVQQLKKNYQIALQLIPQCEIIIQEIIPGSGQNQFSIGVLFLNGSAIMTLSVCRMRQHPLDFGNATTYAETVHIPQIKEYAMKLLQKVDYNGICEVEFKLDAQDNQYKLLEVNPRTWKWHTLANQVNIPLLREYYHFLVGNKVSPVNSYKSASFCHALTDVPIRLLLLLKGSSLWKRKIKPVEKAVWDRKDIFPWLYEKLYIIHYLFNR